MTVTLGTSAGFVTVSPTGDPTGGATLTVDGKAFAMKDTSPAGATKITEVGFYINNATQESNFEVGLYTDDVGGLEPEALLYSSKTNAKGTGEGWKKATVDWTIAENTAYWIAIQLDDTLTSSSLDLESSGGRRSYGDALTLPDDWDSLTSSENTTLLAVYALLGTTGTNTKINIGDSWKEIPLIKINIGDSWKEVSSAKINIGDTWKTIF